MKDSVIPLIIIYLEFNFEFIKKADNSRYANGKNIRLVNLVPIALFSNYQLTTSSGKLSEEFSHVNIVPLLYKLKTSAKDTDDLFIGFDRDRRRWQQAIANYKNNKGKLHVRIMPADIFEFAKHQEKCIYGLCHEITPTGKKDDAVLSKTEAIAEGGIKIIGIHWL